MTKPDNSGFTKDGEELPPIPPEELNKPAIALPGRIRLESSMQSIPLYKAARLIADAKHEFDDIENSLLKNEYKKGLIRAAVRDDIRLRNPWTSDVVKPEFGPEMSKSVITLKDFIKYCGSLDVAVDIIRLSKSKKPIPKMIQQEEAVLLWLDQHDLDSKKLPDPKPGRKGGIKSKARKSLMQQSWLFSSSSFNKAWERLLKDVRISYE